MNPHYNSYIWPCYNLQAIIGGISAIVLSKNKKNQQLVSTRLNTVLFVKITFVICVFATWGVFAFTLKPVSFNRKKYSCIIYFGTHSKSIFVAELVLTSDECPGSSFRCRLCCGNQCCYSEGHTSGRGESVCPLQPVCHHKFVQHHKRMPLWPHTHLCKSIYLQSLCNQMQMNNMSLINAFFFKEFFLCFSVQQFWWLKCISRQTKSVIKLMYDHILSWINLC